MTIKPFGAVAEVWSGWGCRTSRTKIVPVDQLPFVTKQLHEQTAAWCKNSFELRSITLCRHDEAMAEIDGLTKERDAAFAMSRCECGTDEACANLVAKDGEIERLQAENTALRQQLAEARNKALDEAATLIETIIRDELKDSEGVCPPDYFDEGTSAAHESILALKDKRT